jgi:NADH:ubiquinone oxidoreductase subunit K
LLITSLNLIISMVFFIIGFWGVILKQERIF